MRKSTEAKGAARKRGGGTPQKSLPPKRARKGSPRKGSRAEQQKGPLGQDNDSDEQKGEDTEGGQGRDDATDQVRGGSEDAFSAADAALVEVIAALISP